MFFYRLISIINPIRAPFRVLVSLLITDLLSPPTLQGFRIFKLRRLPIATPEASVFLSEALTEGTMLSLRKRVNKMV